jgi:hypothetical protein
MYIEPCQKGFLGIRAATWWRITYMPNRQTSEFGKGLIYCLVLFIKHFENDMARDIGRKHFVMSKSESEREEILSDNPDPRHTYGWNKEIRWWYTHMVPIHGSPEATLSSDISMWFNGASDHLYELEDAGNFVPEIREEIETLKSGALEIGHGFRNTIWTFEHMENLRKLALQILMVIDAKIGANPVKAQWE